MPRASPLGPKGTIDNRKAGYSVDHAHASRSPVRDKSKRGVDVALGQPLEGHRKSHLSCNSSQHGRSACTLAKEGGKMLRWAHSATKALTPSKVTTALALDLRLSPNELGAISHLWFSTSVHQCWGYMKGRRWSGSLTLPRQNSSRPR